MKHTSVQCIRQPRGQGFSIHLPFLMATLSFLFLNGVIGLAFGAVGTPQIVDRVPIHHHDKDTPFAYSIPIYQANDIRFISGGVGVEERKAAYPAFSLKIILAEQPHVFLAHVSLLVKDSEGRTVLHIPQELVTGPWVFINLPEGQYHITGENRKGIKKERTVQVKSGPTRVVHFVWPTS